MTNTFKKVISLSGAIGAGKDTVKDIIAKLAPVKQIRFADKIQDVTAVIGGFYKEDLSHRKLFDNRDWKENHVLFSIDGQAFTVRHFMRLLGNGMREAIHPRFWINFVKQEVEKLGDNEVGVITDTRYENEVNFAFDELYALVIYIDRKEAYDKMVERGLHEHPSESFVPQIKEMTTFVLDNNGTLEELESQVESIMYLENMIDPMYALTYQAQELDMGYD